MHIRSKTALGVLFTSLSALLYGALPVFTKFSYAAGNNAETFNFYKSAWTIPFLVLITVFRKKSVILPKRLALWAVLAGVLDKGITSLLLFLSYKYVSGGISTTLHFMYPMFVAFIGWAFFRNKLPVYKWITLFTATISIAMFVDFSAGGSGPLGVLYAIASGIVYAVFITVVDKSGISNIDPFVFALYLAVSGAAFSLIFGLCTGTLHLAIPVQASLYAASAAVTTSILAAVCFQRGIHLLGGASAAFFSMLEPVGSCILGAIFLAETMNLWSVIGTFMILGSEIVMIWLDNRHAGNATTAV